MGYTIAIFRQDDWDNPEEESNISFEEWSNYIDTDEELERPAESSLTDDNREHYLQNPGYCEWNNHSSYKEPFARPWFEYSQGEIVSKYVDDESLLKMIEIADRLNAKVRGQDGEIYEEDDAMKLKTTQTWAPASSVPAPNKPWWKFW
jgi:hypothetical protein